MSAISYSLTLGAPLESVVAATNAPAAGQVEIRFDQTATTVTDSSVAGGVRALKKGEIYTILRILGEKLINDSNVAE
jgi:hypothetical protein